MTEPTFKPETWIVFQQETNGGFGRIVGGYHDGESWQYTVEGASLSGDFHAVRNDEVTLALQNGSWIAPSKAGGQGSVYTDTTPSL